MTTYPETTLAEFTRRADAYGDGSGSGPTICYRGLSRADKGAAKQWLRLSRDQALDRARIHAMHMRVEEQRLHARRAMRFGELLDRYASL